MKSVKLLFVALLSAGIFVPGVFGQEKTQPATQPAVQPAKPAAAEPKKEEPKKDEPKKDEAKKDDAKKDAFVYIHMKTSMGDIYLELDAAAAPISTENFCKYTDKGFYDGTIFHRVMPNFMIQGGGFTPDMKQKATEAQIKNEWRNGLKNVRGTIAMARLSGNPDSATSQFFINVRDNGSLDQAQGDGAGYAVFGKVISGMAVVDKIKDVKTGNHGNHEAVPFLPVLIEKVSRMSKEDADKITAKK